MKNGYDKVILFLMCFVLLLGNYKRAEATTSDIDSRFDSVKEYLDQELKKAHVKGVSLGIVDKDGLVYTYQYGEAGTLDTPYIIGSLSKSFTAMAIIQLFEQKQLDLNASISEYLPELKNSNAMFDKVSVRQLLNQQSGLGVFDYSNNPKFSGTYGTFEYSNANYNLLGDIVSNVSGMSYEDYINEYIFKPLDMNNSYVSVEKAKANGLINSYRNFFGISVSYRPAALNEDSWIRESAGYISSNITDMSRYLQMYLNEGTYNDNVLLGKDYLKIMQSGGSPYAMGWVQEKINGGNLLYHTGIVASFNAYMALLPKHEIGVIFLSNSADYLVSNEMIRAIEREIPSILNGNEPTYLLDNGYLLSHSMYNGIFLIILMTAILPVLFLRRWKSKLDKSGKIKKLIPLVVVHFLYPIGLFCVFPVTSITFTMAIEFAPDIAATVFLTEVILIITGLFKLVLFKKSFDRGLRF